MIVRSRLTAAASPVSTEDLVDQAVDDRLVRREPGVAVGVLVDPVDRLPGGLGEDVVDQGALAQDRLGGALEVGGLALEPLASRLVDQDAGVGGGAAAALAAGGQQHRGHRRRQAGGGGPHRAREVPHGVEHRQPREHVAAGRVDAHVDRRVGVLGLQVQPPGHDVLRHLAGDHAREQDHTAAQQAVDRVDRAVDGVGVVTNAHACTVPDPGVPTRALPPTAKPRRARTGGSWETASRQPAAKRREVIMSGFHKIEGFVIVAGWGVLFLWGLGLFILKREAGRLYWVQLVAGIVLLALGHRRPVLHYLYGAVLPAIVLVVCHLFTRSLQKGPYHLFFTWGAFFIFGLTARALMTGLGIG